MARNREYETEADRKLYRDMSIVVGVFCVAIPIAAALVLYYVLAEGRFSAASAVVEFVGTTLFPATLSAMLIVTVFGLLRKHNEQTRTAENTGKEVE